MHWVVFEAGWKPIKEGERQQPCSSTASLLLPKSRDVGDRAICCLICPWTRSTAPIHPLEMQSLSQRLFGSNLGHSYYISFFATDLLCALDQFVLPVSVPLRDTNGKYSSEGVWFWKKEGGKQRCKLPRCLFYTDFS